MYAGVEIPVLRQIVYLPSYFDHEEWGGGEVAVPDNPDEIYFCNLTYFM